MNTDLEHVNDYVTFDLFLQIIVSVDPKNQKLKSIHLCLQNLSLTFLLKPCLELLIMIPKL